MGFDLKTQDVTRDYAIGQRPPGVIPKFDIIYEVKKHRDPNTEQDVELVDDNGNPQTEAIEIIEITVIGNNRKKPRRRVSENDRRVFAQDYEAWKRGRAQTAIPDGDTRIEELPAIAESWIQMLQHNSVYSIEQLAGLDDQKISLIGIGADKMRERARAWVARAKEGAGDTRMATELATMRKQLEMLTKRTKDAEEKAQGYRQALDILKEGDDDDDLDDTSAPAAKAPAKRGRGKARKSTSSAALSKKNAQLHQTNPNAVRADEYVPTPIDPDAPSSEDNAFAAGSADPVAAVLDA